MLVSLVVVLAVRVAFAAAFAGFPSFAALLLLRVLLKSRTVEKPIFARTFRNDLLLILSFVLLCCCFFVHLHCDAFTVVCPAFAAASGSPTVEKRGCSTSAGCRPCVAGAFDISREAMLRRGL